MGAVGRMKSRQLAAAFGKWVEYMEELALGEERKRVHQVAGAGSSYQTHGESAWTSALETVIWINSYQL